MDILNLPLTVKIIYEKESSDAPYVAYNPELDVTSCGPTEEKARENLQEAIGIVLEYAEKEGTLEAVLEDAGFRKVRRVWHLPKIVFEPFSIPMPKVLEKVRWAVA